MKRFIGRAATSMEKPLSDPDFSMAEIKQNGCCARCACRAGLLVITPRYEKQGTEKMPCARIRETMSFALSRQLLCLSGAVDQDYTCCNGMSLHSTVLYCKHYTIYYMLYTLYSKTEQLARRQRYDTRLHDRLVCQMPNNEHGIEL